MEDTMSCMVVCHAHIDAILDIEEQYGHSDRLRRPHGAHDDNALGRQLLFENLKAYAIRYREPLPCKTDSTYCYVGTGHKFTPGEALKILGCYLYQLAEYDNWEEEPCAYWTLKLKELVIERAIPRPEGPSEWRTRKSKER
jgi:hypothetical protein